MQFTCPVCQSPLQQNGNNLRCENNHSFDKARQGYWNLLLVQNKRSKDPGDNQTMVQARRGFLDQGHYQPLSDQINQLAAAQISDENCNILDMGCGEGYYSARLSHFLNKQGFTPDLAALDISKHAVKAACRRDKSIHWLVASGAQIPLPDNSLDLQLVLFCRLMPEALSRPLKPGAKLLVAWPAEQHLIELRQLIYSEIKTSHYDPISLLQEQFSHQETVRVSYPFTLNSSAEISTLLQMTPHSQRLNAEAKEKICNLPTLNLTLDVNLSVFTCL